MGLRNVCVSLVLTPIPSHFVDIYLIPRRAKLDHVLKQQNRQHGLPLLYSCCPRVIVMALASKQFW